MQIDKQQILELIKNKAGGGGEQAAQAEQDLPDQVDTDQHADLLGKLGINPQELLGKLGGGGGGGGESGGPGGLAGLGDKLGM